LDVGPLFGNQRHNWLNRSGNVSSKLLHRESGGTNLDSTAAKDNKNSQIMKQLCSREHSRARAKRHVKTRRITRFYKLSGPIGLGEQQTTTSILRNATVADNMISYPGDLHWHRLALFLKEFLRKMKA
jgi:hypothetical protein